MGAFQWLSRHGTKIIAGSAVVGLLLPDLAYLLRPYIGNFVVAMLTVSLLRVDFSAFTGRMRRPTPALMSAGWIALVIPLAVLVVASLLPPPMSGIAVLTVLFLFCAPPPIVSAPAFAMLMGLDGALVLAVMLVATVATPLLTPWLAAEFVAETLPISALDLAWRLASIIGAAIIVAIVLRRLFGKRRIEQAKPQLDTAGVAIAVMFAIGSMEGVSARFLAEPVYVLLAATAAFGAMFAQLALTYAVFRPFVGVDAVAIAYAAANRNVGLVVAALGATAVDDTIWLFFALSQLPVFTFPLILSSLGRRLTGADNPHGRAPSP